MERAARTKRPRPAAGATKNTSSRVARSSWSLRTNSLYPWLKPLGLRSYLTRLHPRVVDEGTPGEAGTAALHRLGRDPLVRTLSATDEVAALLT